MPKLLQLVGVRCSDPDGPELWRSDESGRLVVRVSNEAGYSGTEIDLLDLLAWVADGNLNLVETKM